MFTATLIAADRLTQGEVSTLAALLSNVTLFAGQDWLAPDKACDLHFAGDMTAARAAIEDAIPGIDVIVQRTAQRARKLLVADSRVALLIASSAAIHAPSEAPTSTSSSRASVSIRSR